MPDTVSSVLKWIFSYIFYPAVIIGVFVFVVGMILALIRRKNAARALAGAFLPVVILIFIVVSDVNDKTSLANTLEGLTQWWRFVFGAIVGLVFFETGKQLLKADSAIGAALYCLFLSSVGVFILYCLMSGIIRSIHVLLLGFIVAGALHVIIRGIGDDSLANKAVERNGNTPSKAKTKQETTRL